MKLVALALVAASSVVLFADGKTATATAPVAVHIVSPITLEANGMMQFGKVVADNPNADVVITLVPTDNNSFTAAKTIVNGSDLKSSQSPTVPFFHVRYDSEIGWAGLTVTTDSLVTLGTNVTLVPDLLMGETFLMDNCVYFPIAPGQHAKHFPLGGTLTAKAGVFGKYDGVVSVTAAYN